MARHHLRPARPADAARIAEFATDTFSWGDYVAEAFVEWLDDSDTAVPVIVDEDDIVDGIGRVRMLSDKEGWLSAIRIHPDRRRIGLANQLNDWSVGWIRERGGLVARLQIETWNEAAQNQVSGLGYRHVTSVVNGSRAIGSEQVQPETNGGQRVVGPERLDKAPRSEGHLAYIAWSTSELARDSRSMIAAGAWEWRKMTPEDAADPTLWHCPAGWALLDRIEGSLMARWLMCTPDDADRLIRAIVDLAHDEPIDHLAVVGPATPWLIEAATRLNFELHPSHIFEKGL